MVNPMRALTRKLMRDVLRLKGQLMAVSVVMGCGLAMMILSRSLIRTLEGARAAYYRDYGFADVFCEVKRAPRRVAQRLAELPGVGAVETRVTGRATLEMPGMQEPVDGLFLSIPDGAEPQLNRLCVRRGRLPDPARRGETVVGEAFATVHGLEPGAELEAVMRGVRQRLRVVGIALSPEFVFEARPGETLPDARRFGVFWMRERELGGAYGLEGAFNSVLLEVSGGVAEVCRLVDRVLEPYGGLVAYGRPEHASAQRLDDELRVVRGLSLAFPAVFLSIAAFMTSAVVARLIRLQREQIAQLKAFGYTGWEVGRHYLGFAWVVVGLGGTLGFTGGVWLGRQVVGVYHRFFRFPTLEFALSWEGVFWAFALGMGATLLGVLGAVRAAVRLPPAEAMRPEAPARYRQALAERLGWKLPPLARMVFRNIERRPWGAFFTVLGLALATAIPMVPGAMRDGIEYLLGFQWDRAQRQTVTLGWVEPDMALAAMRQLPGVLQVEGFRSVAARLEFGGQSRRIPVMGMERGSELSRLLDAAGDPVELPLDGLLLSAKLGERLGVKAGDMVRLRVLEGKRPAAEVRVGGLVTDYAGVTATMEVGALRRLLREGPVWSGGHLVVDGARWGEFLSRVKQSPRIATLGIKEAVRRSFRKSTGDMIGMIQTLYFGFSAVVSVGVVYNSARIAFSERSRELATLRVLGFTPAEVAAVMVGELVFLTLVAILPGLWLGGKMAGGIVAMASTETVRLPLVLTGRAYATAAGIVLISAAGSCAWVARRIRDLDLLAVLKAAD
jgi:putative ABC transport system permease protein